jgi:hypothetical protein
MKNQGHCTSCEYFPDEPQNEWCEKVPLGPELKETSNGYEPLGNCPYWKKRELKILHFFPRRNTR